MNNLKKNLIWILLIFLALPSINALTCIGASVSNFTINDTGNHTRTVIGYGNVGGCLVGDIIVTPPSTGGGGSFSGTSNITDIDKFFDKDFLCNESKKFLNEFGRNYTESEFKEFRNNIQNIGGFAIESKLLEDFVKDFDRNCKKPTLAISMPDEEIKEKGFNFGFLFVLIILMAFTITLIVTHKKRKKGAMRSAVREFLRNLKR